ncbi:MAG: efflux RND transporter periplasmic adaptor subunit [Coriobacteriales bacterium]|jgi:HlyD family secretion protein
MPDDDFSRSDQPVVPVVGVIDSESEEEREERIAIESLQRHRKRRRRKRVIAGCIAGVVVVVIIASLVLANLGAGEQQGSGEIQTVSVASEDYSDSINASGKTEPVSSVVVTPEVDGTISDISVSEGDSVEKGDVLFTIKNDELDSQVEEAKLTLQGAQVDYDAAVSTYNSLVDQSNNPVVDENGNAIQQVSSSDLASAYNAVNEAKFQVEKAKTAYDDAVSLADKRTVRAPSSGTVIVMNAKTGSSVSQTEASSQVLLEIADLSKMTVSVQVNEVDISKVAVGQKATVTFSALPDVALDAQVTHISNVSSLDEMTDATGESVVSYTVDLLISKPVKELKSGMTATVSIVLKEVPDATTVPVSALATDDGENYYVLREISPGSGQFERVDVEVKAQDESLAAISGVSAGDVVIFDPSSVVLDSDGYATAANAGSVDSGSDSSDAGASDGSSASGSDETSSGSV